MNKNNTKPSPVINPIPDEIANAQAEAEIEHTDEVDR